MSRTADVLGLLGGMAESRDEHGVAPATVRETVAEQLPLLLPLLAAGEPDIRRTAAWVVSHTRATSRALPALDLRWDGESEPPVRAEVLAGIARLDPQSGAAVATTVLDPFQPAEVRMAAVFASLDADAAVRVFQVLIRAETGVVLTVGRPLLDWAERGTQR
ncbi:hypothetical protein J7F03_39030 [Streptomyces sp. ISL-43]|uniref:hypothetical protein n=1 Tax=Streptomyces sp. ISL-43 TaxID=2819183 RepID=UPI001BE92F93|nr:hypothetical protein [Streptomyces sp. ISL-43]MBT2452926.1 hypothetical protein [Streptomyces sp. ISL-43]